LFRKSLLRRIDMATGVYRNSSRSPG